MKSAFARLKAKAVKGSAFKKNLRAVYFDTVNNDLHAKGLSFRVRDEDGRFVQTLKKNAASHEALTRGEWSDDVSTTAPELLHTKSGRKLRHALKDDRLLSRFRTDIARDGFLSSPRPGTRVEIVRDQGEIRAIGQDGEVALVSEIELELKKGAPSAIYELALRILAAAPVLIETRSKADRGYALLSPHSEVAVVKADAPVMRGGETLAEVLRSAARRHFGQFLANMAGAIRHDPASIHQMRVSMRRLRSALYAVRDMLPEGDYETMSARLKFFLLSLGAARDWEILTETMSDLEEQDAADQLGIEALRRAANLEKRRALVRAVDAIGSRKNTRTVLEALLWFEKLPTARHARKLKAMASDTARGLLTQLLERVRRRLRHFEAQSVGDRHRLRIACKNLRYNIELLGSLFGKREVKEFLACLKPVQDDLGHLNDVSRARDLLGKLAKRSPRKVAADALVARLEARMTVAHKRARKHVSSLRNAKPFW